MSRVTPPVTKLTQVVRRLSSNAGGGRPSGLLDAQSRASLPRNLKDKAVGTKNELADRLAAHDAVGSHNFHSMSAGGHRPTPTTSAPIYKTIPLMQGFQTSAPKQAAKDNSTIDFFFFPEIPADPPLNPFSKLRVPLLPDNYNPDRSPNSGHALDSLDTAVPRPEISIMAAHPENIHPAAMSEVVGNDGMEDIGHLTTGFTSMLPEVVKEPGAIKELWNGLVDDILGPKGSKVAV